MSNITLSKTNHNGQSLSTPGKLSSAILKVLVYLAAIVTFGALLYVIVHILIRGIPYLTPSLFEWEYNTENVSMMPAIINTVKLIALTLLFVIPLGIGTAIYTVEYAKPGNKFVKLTRLMTETLQGIPSIIYGLFGMLFFANTLDWGFSLLGGALTMTLMTLPLVIRSTEEALLAVPMRLRQASYGLGARKLRTTFNVVLPAASMGVFSGIILAIGRIFGETAALIYTAGSMAQHAGLMDNGRTLAIHMYMLQTESRHKDQAYATAVVLLIVVIIINSISSWIESKLAEEME